MSLDELELMRELKRLSLRIPGFVLEFANDDLPVDAEIAFVHQLAEMAEGLLRHANARRGLTVDGQPMPLVIDAEVVGVVGRHGRPGHKLSPGTTPGDRL